MESFRKAYGALKDSTTVGLAKVNSEFKDLDIAIVKATNHVESPPKERHVRKIFMAVALTRPRADVSYCIHALSRRLLKTRNWIVAVKTLIVIHRTFREADPSFKEELLNYSQRAKLLQLSNFKDDSSPLAWNCSAWVRAYALFLEERLECFRALNYDIETDRTTKAGSRMYNKAHSKTHLLNPLELLEYLPALQLLLYRLMGCQPEGAACQNHLIQYALALVLKESFKIYCAINDGIINLVDMFFEMPKHNAVKALAIYKKAGEQAEHLADYYAYCKNLDLARTFHFPKLKQPPPSFLATMEEYIKETPQTGSVSAKRLEYHGAEEQRPNEEIKEQVEDDESVDVIKEMDTMIKEEIPAPFVAEEPADFLGLNGVNSQASEWEETNALALAIVQPGNDHLSYNNNALSEIGKTSGWELALVSAPSNINKPQAIETKMGGGFDKLLLDSLYEDDTARRTLQLHSAGYSTSYGYEMTAQNPFDHQGPDPFAVSNNIARQQEQMMMLQNQHNMMMLQNQPNMLMMQNQHNMMMVPYNNNDTYTGTQYSQQQYEQMGSSNPFGDPFNYYPQSGMAPQYGNHTLL